MNERIRELRDKCVDPEYGWVDVNKFAELIVRECIVQIGDAIPDTNCSAADAYKTAKLAATSRVKEHFGVK